jgi:sugar lactone lactonase YvrE
MDDRPARAETAQPAGRHEMVAAVSPSNPRRLALAFAALAISMLLFAAPVLAASPPNTVTRFAGLSGTCERSTPGPATSSALCFPSGVAVDAYGNVYIADTGNYDIEKVTPGGVLSIIAGQPDERGAPTEGPAASSKLGEVGDITVDTHGNLYLADSSNGVVEKITPQRTLSIVAGKVGEAGPPTEGPATSSDLSEPSAVAVDGSDDVYVADTKNDVVEKIANGELSIIAGKVGEYGPPTAGPARESNLGLPVGLAVDASDNVYIGDLDNDVVEKVTPAGTLSIFAGKVEESSAPTEGPATSSHLGAVYGVAVDASGNVYITSADDFVVANCDVDEVTGGNLIPITGNDLCETPNYGGPASESPSDYSSGIAVDSSGVVYVADYENSTIDRITPKISAGSATVPATTSTTVPATTTTATGTSTVTASVAAAQCKSTRTETIHWKLPGGVRPPRILITLNGKPYEQLSGGARKATVSFAGRGQGAVAVTITATTGHAERYTATRTFEPCTAPRAIPTLPNLYLRRR